MAIEKKTTIDDFGKAPDGVSDLIKEREMKKENQQLARSLPHLFNIAIIVSIASIALFYAILPLSRIKAISVTGEEYLSKRYIQELSGITYDSMYFLTFPGHVSSLVEKDPMIEDVKTRLLPGNTVQLNVTEKQPVGYRYEEDGPYILTADGSHFPLTSEYMTVISRVPLIEGFTEEDQTHKLINALSQLSRTIIGEIAEIDQYSLDYDDEVMEIQMRDGGYFFSGYYSIELVNHYHEIYMNLTDKGKCLFADSGSKIAYSKACPWNEVPTEYVYWLDDQGNPLLNKWGDKAVVHYYHDANGHFYLDEQGNKIVIPIDEYAQDIRDPNFEENFLAGYYATGELVIPPEEGEEENPEASPEASAEPSATPEG